MIALALRLGVLIATGQFGRSPSPDYREYVIAGQRFLESGTMLSPMIPEEAKPGPSAFLPPVYVAITAGAYGLFGVETFAATAFLQVLNALATTAAVAVVLAAARELAGQAAGWIAAILLACNPIVVGYVGFIWDTSLFVLAVAISVLFSIRLGRTSFRLLHFFAFGAWLGLLAHLNPALTLCYPLLAIGPLFAQTRKVGSMSRSTIGRHAVLGCSMTVAGWLIVITPWTVRNHSEFGELMYVRTGFMHEIWLGVCPEAEDNPRDAFNRQFVLRNPELQRIHVALGERGYINECGRMAREAIAADPLRWFKLMGIRAVDFWAGTIRSHADPQTLLWWPRSPLRLAIALFALAEFALLLFGLMLRRPPPGLRRLIGMAVVFSLTYIATQVQIRYRTPIEPILAMVIGLTMAGRLGLPFRKSE